MPLFKILVRHHAPKDSHGAVEGFLLRDTEEEVCDWVMTNLGLCDLDELDEEVEFWDEEHESPDTITRRESLLRNNGQIYHPDNDYADAYYGITHYGWEEVGEPTPDEIGFLRRCGVLLGEDEE